MCVNWWSADLIFGHITKLDLANQSKPEIICSLTFFLARYFTFLKAYMKEN